VRLVPDVRIGPGREDLRARRDHLEVVPQPAHPLVACVPHLGYAIATDGSRVQYDEIGWLASKEAAHRSAVHDLPCDGSRVTVSRANETQYVADGCGQRAVYTVNDEASTFRVDPNGTRITECPMILMNRFSLAAPAH
jgi:hypothetical protein